MINKRLPETNIRFVLQLSLLGFFHDQGLKSMQEPTLITNSDLNNTFHVGHVFVHGLRILSTEKRWHYNIFLYLFPVIQNPQFNQDRPQGNSTLSRKKAL